MIRTSNKTRSKNGPYSKPNPHEIKEKLIDQKFNQLLSNPLNEGFMESLQRDFESSEAAPSLDGCSPRENEGKIKTKKGILMKNKKDIFETPDGEIFFKVDRHLLGVNDKFSSFKSGVRFDCEDSNLLLSSENEDGLSKETASNYRKLGPGTPLPSKFTFNDPEIQESNQEPEYKPGVNFLQDLKYVVTLKYTKWFILNYVFFPILIMAIIFFFITPRFSLFQTKNFVNPIISKQISYSKDKENNLPSNNFIEIKKEGVMVENFIDQTVATNNLFTRKKFARRDQYWENFSADFSISNLKVDYLESDGKFRATSNYHQKSTYTGKNLKNHKNFQQIPIFDDSNQTDLLKNSEQLKYHIEKVKSNSLADSNTVLRSSDELFWNYHDTFCVYIFELQTNYSLASFMTKSELKMQQISVVPRFDKLKKETMRLLQDYKLRSHLAVRNFGSGKEFEASLCIKNMFDKSFIEWPVFDSSLLFRSYYGRLSFPGAKKTIRDFSFFEKNLVLNQLVRYQGCKFGYATNVVDSFQFGIPKNLTIGGKMFYIDKQLQLILKEIASDIELFKIANELIITYLEHNLELQLKFKKFDLSIKENQLFPRKIKKIRAAEYQNKNLKKELVNEIRLSSFNLYRILSQRLLLDIEKLENLATYINRSLNNIYTYELTLMARITENIALELEAMQKSEEFYNFKKGIEADIGQSISDYVKIREELSEKEIEDAENWFVTVENFPEEIRNLSFSRYSKFMEEELKYDLFQPESDSDVRIKVMNEFTSQSSRAYQKNLKFLNKIMISSYNFPPETVFERTENSQNRMEQCWPTEELPARINLQLLDNSTIIPFAFTIHRAIGQNHFPRVDSVKNIEIVGHVNKDEPIFLLRREFSNENFAPYQSFIKKELIYLEKKELQRIKHENLRFDRFEITALDNFGHNVTCFHRIEVHGVQEGGRNKNSVWASYFLS